MDVKYDGLSIKELRSSTEIQKNAICQQVGESMHLYDLNLHDASKRKTVKISSLLNNGPQLFFRFRESHCDVCINNIFDLLKNTSISFPLDHIVVICGYSNTAQFRSYVTNNDINAPIYNMVDSLPLPMEGMDYPYFFVMDKNRIVQNAFIPIKGIPD